MATHNKMTGTPEAKTYPYLKRVVEKHPKGGRKISYRIIYGPHKMSRAYRYKDKLVSEIYRPELPITNFVRGIIYEQILTRTDIKYTFGEYRNYKPHEIFHYYSPEPMLRQVTEENLPLFFNSGAYVETYSPNSMFFFFSNEQVYSPVFATKKGIIPAIHNMHLAAQNQQLVLSDEDIESFIHMAIHADAISGGFINPKVRA